MVSDNAHSTNPRPFDSAAAAAATDWLALFWRRKLIVILVIAVALVLGILYHQQATPIYQSSAQVLLIKNEADLPITGEPLDSDGSTDTTARTPGKLITAWASKCFSLPPWTGDCSNAAYTIPGS